jgi:hypothetical protein
MALKDEHLEVGVAVVKAFCFSGCRCRSGSKQSIDFRHVSIKARIYKELVSELPDLKPDLSNFDSALLRWKRRHQRNIESKSDEIKDWLMEPNQGTSWESYIKKVIYNLHIHGADATYKQVQDGKLENFDSLVGLIRFIHKTPECNRKAVV